MARPRPCQAFSAIMVTVVSMTGKFWVNVYCSVLCGHGSPEVSSPLYPPQGDDHS